MRLTVVGAILIVAGIVVVAVMLHALLDKSNRGPEQNNPRPGGDYPGGLGA
jgi:hypothetical protein